MISQLLILNPNFFFGRTGVGRPKEKPPTTDLLLERARAAKDLLLLMTTKTMMMVLNWDWISSRSVTLGRS